MAEAVLDASAVLALLQGEAGGDAVAEVLPRSVISTVNLAEVIAKLIDHGVSPADAEAILDTLPFEIAPASPADGRRAGSLHAQTRGRGVSLGDRFCLGLGQATSLPVFTADQAWARLGLALDIRLIR
jgi:PIN domain nuclease of toxin-antitoxin system